MGRPRKSPSTRPPCYFESHGAWFLVKKGKWNPLPAVRSELDAWTHHYAALKKPAKEHQLDGLIDGAYEQLKKQPRKKPWSGSTLQTYSDGLKKLKHLFRQFSNLDQVKQKHAAQVKVLLAKTPTAANHTLSISRQVFNVFLEQQLIESNPFVGVKRYQTAARTRLLLWEEWWRIHAIAPRRLQLVMDGLYLTDQRIDDLLDLDERDGVADGVYFEQSKTGKEIIVRWNPDLRAWWDACRELHGKVVKVNFEIKDRPRPLFRSRHGTRPAYKTVYDQWVLACKRAGVEDANLHDNRAFSATEMKKQAGGGEHGEAAAQALLGHDERRTTKIYLRGREVEVVEGPSIRRLIGSTP